MYESTSVSHHRGHVQAKKNTLKVTTSTASSISVTAKDVSFNGGGDTSRASAEAKAETGMNGFDEEQRMNDSKRSEGAGRNSGGDGIARLGTDSTSLVTNSTSVTMATNLTTTVTVAPPTPAPAMVVDPKRPVLASFVTGSMKEFLSNWAASAESVGLFNDIQVAAFDQGAVDACTEIKLNCVPIFEANGSSTTEFGGVATGGITLDGKRHALARSPIHDMSALLSVHDFHIFRFRFYSIARTCCALMVVSHG